MKITTQKIKSKYSRLIGLLILPLTLSFFSLNSVANEAISTRGFVEQASMKSLTTIQSAENALKATKSQLVSAYANKMVDEYKNIHSNVMKLADEKDIDLTKKSEAKKDAKETALQAGNNNRFDVAYAKNQIAFHQNTISLFQRASESDDYETRALAKTTLPHLQRHLQMAEQLYAVTAESKTDIFQDRENKVDYSDEGEAPRTPSTDKTAP